MRYLLITVNMPNNVEEQLPAPGREFPGDATLRAFVQQNYPGWTSLVVTVLPRA